MKKTIVCMQYTHKKQKTTEGSNMNKNLDKHCGCNENQTEAWEK